MKGQRRSKGIRKHIRRLKAVGQLNPKHYPWDGRVRTGNEWTRVGYGPVTMPLSIQPKDLGPRPFRYSPWPATTYG